MTYANAADRQRIVCTAACMVYADKLAGESFPGSVKAKRSLKAVQSHAEKALTAMLEQVPQEQISGIMRLANASILMAMPSTSPQAQKEYYVVPTEVMERLLGDVTADCMLCTKEGKELRRCQRRRDMMEAGIIPAGERECPYQG